MAFVKTFAKCLIVTLVLTHAEAAFGVTKTEVLQDEGSVEAVTTTVAMRARTDVQIRRIKSLIVNRRGGDQDAAYEQLERLQKNLRGEN